MYFFDISELDFDFIRGLRSQVQDMRTKHIWQPALRKLFSFPCPDDRRTVLQFLLETMKKFQVGVSKASKIHHPVAIVSLELILSQCSGGSTPRGKGWGEWEGSSGSSTN